MKDCVILILNFYYASDKVIDFDSSCSGTAFISDLTFYKCDSF